MAIGKGSVNRVTLIGNLGADPQLKQTPNSINVLTLAIATNEIHKDKQQHTEWHRVVLWRRLAEIAAEHLKKGSKIYVEGSLRTRTWQDNNGNQRMVTEVIGERLTMLETKNDIAENAPAPDADVPQENNEPPETDD